MNAYLALRKKQQEEFSTLPIVYAFGEKQFAEAMQKLGLRPKDKAKVCSIYGAGDIIKKEDFPKWLEMQKKHNREFKEAIAGDETGEGFIFDMFDAELSNHEYGYTRDSSYALGALGLTLCEVYSDTRLAHGYEKACKHQAEWCDSLKEAGENDGN